MADNTEVQLLERLREALRASGVPQVAGMAFEDQHLMAPDRRLAITAQVLDQAPGRLHAHVIAWLPDSAAPAGKYGLDACIMGFGGTLPEATQQAALVWLRLVGAPVLSCLAARPLLDADHFEGSEEWGVPGGHGFVGPFMVRGKNNSVDQDRLRQSAAFRFDAYPGDHRAHLIKVTLDGHDRRWVRHLEIDGHEVHHVEEGWAGLPVPEVSVVCVRFAVYWKD